MPTAQQIQQAVREVEDRQSFIRLLRETLDWPINLDFDPDIEDITYEWTDEDLNTEGLTRDVLSGPVLQMQSLEQEHEQPWGVFILEFTNETPFTTGRGLVGPLRKVLRGLVPKRRQQRANLRAWNRENLLFICTHEYRHFRFAYFKTPRQEGRGAPLTMFGWEPGVPPRTVCDYNLKHLEWPDDPSDGNAWVTEWSRAFDVEAVTKQFYEDYEEIFTALQTQVQGLPDEEDRKLFVQTLMNRLLFLRFVERKGWLRFDTNQVGPQDYLQLLYQAGPVGDTSWYNSRLKPLFFEGMAVRNHGREHLIGNVPYLNGGLFTADDRDEAVTDVPAEAFEAVLGDNGLFYRYNFTVEESTPLEIDVAVDPEMLGKVFEKLVTARRQQGSYYTPRTVVSFMCREALKGYLGDEFTTLVDERSTEGISIPQARDLLKKVNAVKVVDPACGSGAYLLGMLQELFTISSLLDTRASTTSPRDAYHRKLDIIQNNLYGVDIDEFAINIARLRLWLSLAVEFEGDDPESLPNLDFKIECGDALTAPDPSGGIEPGLHRELMKRYVTLHRQYFNPPPGVDKAALLRIITELKEDIVGWLHSAGPVEGFDWQVEFIEAFVDGGFDIIVANPPYGVTVSDGVRNKYFNQRLVAERGQSKDSYGIFVARGLQLLKPDGMLSFIISDTWRTIKSHRPLRKRLLDTTTVFHVLDLPAWIFDATVNTSVLTLRKSAASDDHQIIAGDLRGVDANDWKMLSDNLIAVSGHGPDVQTTACARYTYKQYAISLYNGFSFFISSPTIHGIMGNCRFSKLELIADVKHGLTTGRTRTYIYKDPEARGSYRIAEDALKFDLENDAQRLTNDERVNGFDPSRFHGRFLVPYDKGGACDSEGGWLPAYNVPTQYYIDWRRTSVDAMKRLAGFRHDGRDYYFKKGITFSHTGFYSPTFRLNAGGIFDTAGSCLFSDRVNLTVLLGLLNSKVVRYLFKNSINHTVNAAEDPIKEIPLPSLDAHAATEVESQVNALIAHQAGDPRYPYHLHEQREIDSLVNQMYGLDDVDIREVELWYCRRYSKLAEAQGMVQEVKEKYADHLARCQRVLEKPPSYWRSNPILALIAQGEGHELEFKETLEHDIRQNQSSPGVLLASLKTVAAFLNTDGGTLLVGVSDPGEVKGIDRDLRYVRGHNRDGFEQKLRNLLHDRFEPSPLGHADITFEELADGTVCQVKVRAVPTDQIIHLDDDIYIRDGNVTRKLEGRERTEWIRRRSQE